MWKNCELCSCFLLLSMLGLTSAQGSGCGSSPCPQSNGLFPVPDDCTAFYNCAHCTAYRQQCGPGTAFDPQLRVCNHIHQVDCSGSASYSQRIINERKQGGAVDEASTHPRAHDTSSASALASRSSLNHRYGSAQPVSYTDPESSTVPYPYRGSHGFYSHGNSEANTQQAPARDIYRSGDEVLPSNAKTGHDSSKDQHAARYIASHHSHHHQEPQEHHGGVSARKFLPSGYESSMTNPRTGHYANEDQQSGRHTEGHHHQDFPKPDGEVPARDIYQSGEKSHPTVSRSGYYTNQNQQHGRPADGHHTHHHHHQESHGQSEPSSNVTDIGTVAVPTRSRFNHSHIAHHQEAVSYLPTHQIVYDHSHGEHHLDDHTHTENGGQEFSSNNRGSPQLSKNQTAPTHHTTTVSPSSQNSTANDGAGFDLKARFVANSGFVPSYVRDQMNDDSSPKVGNYGEREYVRSPNRPTEDSGIRNLQGQSINPDRFYTDDVSSTDVDSQESPVQLSADDLRHFQQNQAAQGVTYSSNADRDGRSSFIQPGFRSPYQYPAPSPTASLSSAASSRSEAVQAEQSPERSGQLFVEHRRRKQPQDSPVPSADSRGRSANDGSSGGFDGSESREHTVYVSAPALPTPLPLVANQGRKEYHHMGYRFDHDPLRGSAKTA